MTSLSDVIDIYDKHTSLITQQIVDYAKNAHSSKVIKGVLDYNLSCEIKFILPIGKTDDLIIVSIESRINPISRGTKYSVLLYNSSGGKMIKITDGLTFPERTIYRSFRHIEILRCSPDLPIVLPFHADLGEHEILFRTEILDSIWINDNTSLSLNDLLGNRISIKSANKVV